MAAPIYQYFNKTDNDHCVHPGEPWQGQEKEGIAFYAFTEPIPGTTGVKQFWHQKNKEHTFHFGEAWGGEEGGNIEFYAYETQIPGTEPVFCYWNPKASDHVLRMNAPQGHEENSQKPIFFAFPKQLVWNPNASCDGITAQNRKQWLKDNEGLSDSAAEQRVLSEFVSYFGADAPVPQQPPAPAPSAPAAPVPSAPPAPCAPTAPGAAHFVDCAFPHTLQIVQDAKGRNRLQIKVTPRNPQEVTMVAVHYGINAEPGHESMNFDINAPEQGTNTYVHTTPDFGPVCDPGASVIYWFGVMVKGLIQDMPEKACPHKENRMRWTAQ